MSDDISAEQHEREDQLVQVVLDSFEATEDPRLKELVQGVVRHLHAFLRDVRLTEEEWKQGIDFLTAVGHITDERRQEFILLSDTLGASMQTIAINNEAYADATEATVFGPVLRRGRPARRARRRHRGQRQRAAVLGRGHGARHRRQPGPGARIEVWEADEDGFYDVQYDDDRVAGRAHLFSDDDGAYHFWAITPTPYPIPHDGPVGAMLAATGRSPMRASHLHFMVDAPGTGRW